MKFEYLPGLKEWWQALRWVLLVYTILVALSLAGSFVSYETVTTHGHPWLPLKTCTGCPFCGMTRSFCAMSAGLWAEAWRWNSAGPLLYTFGWLWLTGFGIFIGRAGKKYFGGKKDKQIKLQFYGN